RLAMPLTLKVAIFMSYDVSSAGGVGSAGVTGKIKGPRTLNLTLYLYTLHFAHERAMLVRARRLGGCVRGIVRAQERFNALQVVDEMLRLLEPVAFAFVDHEFVRLVRLRECGVHFLRVR